MSLLILLGAAFGEPSPSAMAPPHAPAAVIEQALLGAWSGRWASAEDGRHGSAEVIFTRGTEPGSLLAEVTFIGTPTAGANGDVTNMVLPGNLTVSFSGHDVRHADGRQLQRLGIQPTIRVERTIRGLIEGRDELLDAAVKFLQTGGTK